MATIPRQFECRNGCVIAECELGITQVFNGFQDDYIILSEGYEYEEGNWLCLLFPFGNQLYPTSGKHDTGWDIVRELK